MHLEIRIDVTRAMLRSMIGSTPMPADHSTLFGCTLLRKDTVVVATAIRPSLPFMHPLSIQETPAPSSCRNRPIHGPDASCVYLAIDSATSLPVIPPLCRGLAHACVLSAYIMSPCHLPSQATAKH
jgi:hypothetical protein